MNQYNFILSLALLLIASSLTGNANAEQQIVNPYDKSKFALGIGTAIVRFDTNIKTTQITSGRKTYIDLEGNLDIPEVSVVTTIYGGYQFKPKHRLGFSYFGINRESDVYNIDKTFEDVRVVGNASITDTTNFYRLDYGYSLFKDSHSKIDLRAGIYGLDLKYVFKADGDITIDGVTTSSSIEEETKVFAPLPLIGLDFTFSITNSWNFVNKLAFITGSYEDLSATVFQASIHALYRFNQNIGVVMGVTYFDADIDIEDSSETNEISYGYDGAYIGMHFFL